MIDKIFTIIEIITMLILLLFLGAFLLYRFFRPEKCPNCGKHAIKMVNATMATILVDGKRAPDAWGYYICGNCGARFKKHVGKTWEDVTDEEWEKYAKKDTAEPDSIKQ